jgi:transposase-like protein
MRRLNLEEKAAVVKDYLGSEMSLRAYAGQKGIGLSTLSKWVRKEVHQTNSISGQFPSCPFPFVELVAAAGEVIKKEDSLDERMAGIQGIEIMLLSQIMIKIGSVSASAFLGLVQGLSHADSLS